MLAKYHAGSLPAILASFPGAFLFILAERAKAYCTFKVSREFVTRVHTAVLRMAFSLRLPFEVLSSSRREPHLSPSPSIFFRLPQPFRLPSFRRPARTRSFLGSCSTPRTATSSRRYGGSDHLLLFLAAEAARSAVGQSVLCTKRRHPSFDPRASTLLRLPPSLFVSSSKSARWAAAPPWCPRPASNVSSAPKALVPSPETGRASARVKGVGGRDSVGSTVHLRRMLCCPSPGV